MKYRRKTLIVTLICIFMLAAGLRFTLAVFVFASTRDTSVVGIMGLHILEGARPLFYYGQAYMGAAEAYLTAVVFALFGASTETLTVVPVVFAVAWCASSYFLFKRLFGTAGGMAAALYIACAGLYTAWYTTGAYGGYPETYFLGTTAIILALRTREEKGRGSVILWSLLGVIYAVGIWINLQILPYLVVSTAVLAFDWAAKKRSLRHAAAIASLGCCALLGVLPGMIVSREIAGMEHMGIDMTMIPANASLLFSKVLERFLFWPEVGNTFLHLLVAAAVLVPSLVYCASLWSSRKEPERFIPALFVLVFLVMYLPHPMAAKVAPRYLIAPAMMLFSAGFATMVASGRTTLRTAGWVFVAFWSVYNFSALLWYCAERQPGKERSLAIRERIVDRALNAGLENVKILGGVSDGLLGANFSFASRDSVRFIAAQDDRILAHHLSWHADSDAGYAFRLDMGRYVRGALKALAATDGEYTTKDFFTLLTPPGFDHFRQYSVDYEVIAAGGIAVPGEALSDNTASTGIEIGAGSRVSLTLALAEEVELSGMRLFPVHETLPEGPYSIAVSTDNIEYVPIFTDEVRVGASYINGNRVFMMDHYPAQDYRWRPRPARYIQVSFINTNRSRVPAISELLLFEYRGSQGEVRGTEVSQIKEYLQSLDIAFVWCDRWLSNAFARKNGGRASDLAVLPPPNLRYYATNPRRDVVLRPDHAIVVANSAAEPCRRAMATALADGAYLTRRSFAHYTVFTVVNDKAYRPKSPEPSLVWNGHTVLKKR